MPFTRRFVLFTEPPHLPVEDIRATIRNGARLPFLEKPLAAASRKAANAMIGQLGSDRIIVIDASAPFDAGDGTIRFVDGKGRVLFQDADHLSSTGADEVIARNPQIFR